MEMIDLKARTLKDIEDRKKEYNALAKELEARYSAIAPMIEHAQKLKADYDLFRRLAGKRIALCQEEIREFEQSLKPAQSVKKKKEPAETPKAV